MQVNYNFFCAALGNKFASNIFEFNLKYNKRWIVKGFSQESFKGKVVYLNYLHQLALVHELHEINLQFITCKLLIVESVLFAKPATFRWMTLKPQIKRGWN